jgi:uncharacterized protein YmfQ (DUF2313 family)
MDVTADDYLQQEQALLPPGAVWPKNTDAGLTKLLLADADELVRIHNRVDQLQDEADPRTTVDLLADWEKDYGLPDQCMSLAATPEERRQRVFQKENWTGGISVPYFQDLLAALGYPGCTVTEFRPMRANSKCNAALNQGGWRFAWRVNVPGSVAIKTMTANSPCNVPLRRWGDTTLNCILATYRPAHTILYIAYGAEA